MPDDEKPLARARSILSAAFPPRREPEPFVPPDDPLAHARSMLKDCKIDAEARPSELGPMPTGIPALDDAIGGGYPVGRFTRVVVPEKRRAEIFAHLVRAFDGPAFLLSTRAPTPEVSDRFTVLEVGSGDAWEDALHELWEFLSSDHDPCLVVLDDTLLGTRDTTGRLRTAWGHLLPKLKAKLARTRDALLTFSAIVEEPGKDRTAWDGQAWTSYASITAVVEPGMTEDLFVVTFEKCKTAPSKGTSVTIDFG